MVLASTYSSGSSLRKTPIKLCMPLCFSSVLFLYTYNSFPKRQYQYFFNLVSVAFLMISPSICYEFFSSLMQKLSNGAPFFPPKNYVGDYIS